MPCLGLSQLGQYSEETLVYRIFSSNGAQRYFLNETEFNASFYCGNDKGTAFVKGPLSYADSLEYCKRQNGQLGELRLLTFYFKSKR